MAGLTCPLLGSFEKNESCFETPTEKQKMMPHLFLRYGRLFPHLLHSSDQRSNLELTTRTQTISLLVSIVKAELNNEKDPLKIK